MCDPLELKLNQPFCNQITELTLESDIVNLNSMLDEDDEPSRLAM